MNLRESFQYMNFLDEKLEEIEWKLRDTKNVVTIKETHMKSASNPNFQDEDKIVEPDIEFEAVQLIDFMDVIMTEKSKLSIAIHEAKNKAEVNLDHAISLNKAKQKQAIILKRLIDLKTKEEERRETAYMINNEGNQVPFYYPVKKVATINYDRNKVKARYKAIKKECDEMSTLIDKTQINTEVVFPDGMTVEIVTNERGTAYKLSNGFMICTRKIQVTMNCSNSWGALYYGQDTTEYNFAQEFTAVPVVSKTLFTTSDDSAMDASYIRPMITSKSYRNLSIVRPTSNSSVPCEFHLIAIGMWK